MLLPNSFFEQIRMQVLVSDIVRNKVNLTRKGSEYSGLCPFHNEKTPSFTVNNQKRFYHCFGCGAHGDVVGFVMNTSGLSYKEAAVKIAEENGIDIPKLSKEQERIYSESEKIYEILELANKFFNDNLDDTAKHYLKRRNIDNNVIEKFSIGYCPEKGILVSFLKNKLSKSYSEKELLGYLEKAGLVRIKEHGKIYEFFNNRITFPIKNIYNKIVGFGGRVLDNSLPKYINSPESIVFKKGEIMFGEHNAISSIHKNNYSLLVEGYMDVIALQNAGIEGVLASLGTAITEKHLQKLWRYGQEVIICLDGDEAGIRAAKRMSDIALPHISAEKKVSFIKIPTGFDPDDYINSKGKAAFQELVARRINLSEQIFRSEFNENILSNPEGRSILESRLLEYVDKIQDKTLAKNFKYFFKDKLWQMIQQHRSGDKKRNVLSHNQHYSGSDGFLVDTSVTGGGSRLTEKETLERSILHLLLQYPFLLQDHEIIQYFISMELNDEELMEFKTWLIDEFENNPELNVEELKKKIEKTRFFKSCSLVLESGAIFLDVGVKDVDNSELLRYIVLLQKKHFLLSLKSEYAGIAGSVDPKISARSVFYIKEIQKVTKEISSLSNSFFN